MQLARALDAFLLQIEADGRSPHTIDQYRRHVGALDRWLAATGRPRDLASIDHDTLALFLVSDAARCRPDGTPKKATSVNNLRTSLRAFWSYLHGAGLAPVNAARLIRRARCSPPPPRGLTDDEVKRLLAAAADRDRPAGHRDAALVRLLLGTGLRIGSALGLRVEDVDLVRGELRVLRVKGDNPHVLPVARAVVRDLRKWIGSRRDGWLFPGAGDGPLGRRRAGQRIAELAEAAGLARRVSAHACRHTWAMRLYNRTGDVLVVQQALGHRAIASTMVYAQADAGRLRRALVG